MRFIFAITLAVITAVPFTGAISGENSENKIDCVECHEQVLNSGNSHLPFSNDDCFLCHEGSMRGDMHDVKTYRDDIVCVSCHLDYPEYNQNLVHNNILCIDCHNPHRSDNDLILMRGEIGLCTESCHTNETLGNSHPVGRKIADPNTGGELTCISTCHSIHSPTQAKSLQLATIDLCQSCHSEKY